MTFEEALADARKEGGTVNWDKTKGFYVDKPILERKGDTGSFESSMFPWSTVAGEGFMLPWTQAYKQDGKWTHYKYGVPTISADAQKYLSDIGYTIPSSASDFVLQPVTVEQTAANTNTDKISADSTLSDLLGSSATRWSTEVKNGYLFLVGYDDNNNVISYDPVGQTNSTYESPTDIPTDPYGRKAVWDADNGEFKYSPDWGVDPVTQASGYISPYQQQQLDLEKQQQDYQSQQDALQWANVAEQNRISQQQFAEQMAWNRQQQASSLAAQKETQLANLRANPASWLEYASLANETPVIQPWMKPLQPQDYNFQIGSEIPGWTKEGSLKSMAELQTPSAQYMSRISPSSVQQYYGYEKARTGATAEDTDWRLWNRAAPSGNTSNLTYQR
jgi:hypothetical protein